MLFQSAVTEQDGGLYKCQASFYHHTATVSFQVDVMCEDRLLCKGSPELCFPDRLYQHSGNNLD